MTPKELMMAMAPEESTESTESTENGTEAAPATEAE